MTTLVLKANRVLYVTIFRKDRKAGLLVSPKEVTVISSVEDLSSANVPADNSSAHPSAQVAPAASSASNSDTSYVTSDQFLAHSP